MNNINAKLDRMANVSKQVVTEAKNKQLEAWSRVKRESPLDAEILTAMGRSFGKLAVVELRIIETNELLKIK